MLSRSVLCLGARISGLAALCMLPACAASPKLSEPEQRACIAKTHTANLAADRYASICAERVATMRFATQAAYDNYVASCADYTDQALEMRGLTQTLQTKLGITLDTATLEAAAQAAAEIERASMGVDAAIVSAETCAATYE